MTPFGGTVIKLELPEVVTPFLTHVARTRTCPKLAGTFGNTHTPFASTGAVRFKALTVHEASSWAPAGRAAKTKQTRNARNRRSKDLAAIFVARFRHVCMRYGPRRVSTRGSGSPVPLDQAQRRCEPRRALATLLDHRLPQNLGGLGAPARGCHHAHQLSPCRPRARLREPFQERRLDTDA